jgi:hypothetical protein
MAVIGPVWYAALAAVFISVDRAHRPVWGIGSALALIAAAVFAAFTMVGTFALAPFAIGGFLVMRRAWNHRSDIRPVWTLKVAPAVSGVAIVALVAGSVFSVVLRLRQKPADLVLMWEGTGPSSAWVNAMATTNPPDLDGLRRVVRESKEYEGLAPRGSWARSGRRRTMSQSFSMLWSRGRNSVQVSATGKIMSITPPR